jgi:hypothetical protein
MTSTTLSPADIRRLLARVRPERECRLGMQTPCWNWAGFRHKKGYGQVKIGGRVWWVHRLAWAIFRGGLPPGKDIHHRCYNPNCMNPDHLEPIDPATHGDESSGRQWNNHDGPDSNGSPF